jgi:hypothetical protein
VPPRKGVFDVRFGGIGLTIRPLPILAGVAIAVSTGLSWLASATGDDTAFDIPFVFLFDRTPDPGGFKLGLALLLVGIAGAVLSFLPGTGPLRRACGVAALAAVIAFGIQWGLRVNDAGGSVSDFFDTVEAGAYVCLVGAFLLSTQR